MENKLYPIIETKIKQSIPWASDNSKYLEASNNKPVTGPVLKSQNSTNHKEIALLQKFTKKEKH